MDLPDGRFLVALPGVSVLELEPVDENGLELTGLQVRFGPDFASHSTFQEFYFGPDLLLARHDYRVEIAGGFPAIQYISDFTEADGIRVPTKRRAYRCGEDGRPILPSSWCRSTSPTATSHKATYVIAEVNSRLPGSSNAAMVLRVFMPTLAVVVVLIPLSYYEFDAVSLWPPDCRSNWAVGLRPRQTV